MSIGVLGGCTQQQTPPPVAGHTVIIKNFAFDPTIITVKVGENVTWTNDDSVPHHVKADDSLFDSNTLSNGQSYTFQFTAVGIYNYTCVIHASMHGRVIVE